MGFIRSVISHQIRPHVVSGSNPGELKHFCSAAILLFYITQRISIPEICIFGKSFAINELCYCRQHLTNSFVRHFGITDGRTLKSTTLVREVPSGITSIQNDSKICPEAFELNDSDRLLLIPSLSNLSLCSETPYPTLTQPTIHFFHIYSP